MRLILTAVLFAVIGTAMMGAGVTFVLSTPGYTTRMLLIAAAAGFALAVPVAWFVAKSVLKTVR